MKTLLLISLFFTLAFAQSELEFLQSVLSQDSIVRATFTQTKQIKSLEKPLVSSGKLLAVRGRGVIWTQENPTFLRNVFLFNDDSPRSQQAMIAPFFTGDFSSLQRRFALNFSQNENDWQLNIVPKSAAIRRNVKHINIKSSLDLKYQEILIFSADDNFVKIEFVSEIPTPQVLSDEEQQNF